MYMYGQKKDRKIGFQEKLQFVRKNGENRH
jgi:hypothetical protein